MKNDDAIKASLPDLLDALRRLLSQEEAVRVLEKAAAELREAREFLAGKQGAKSIDSVVQQLNAEKTQITEELANMAPDAWLNVRGRELANREQELFVTLKVLQSL